MERIAALIVGIFAICFGLMLLPIANALRRRMLARREPPPVVEVTVTQRIPRGWRSHVIPMFFIVFGAALVLLAVSGG